MGDAPLKNMTQSDCLSQILLVSALANSLSIGLRYYSFIFLSVCVSEFDGFKDNVSVLFSWGRKRSC